MAKLTAEEMQDLKVLFQRMFESILTYTQFISKQVDSNGGRPTARYWHQMYNVCFDVMAKVSEDEYVYIYPPTFCPQPAPSTSMWPCHGAFNILALFLPDLFTTYDFSSSILPSNNTYKHHHLNNKHKIPCLN